MPEPRTIQQAAKFITRTALALLVGASLVGRESAEQPPGPNPKLVTLLQDLTRSAPALESATPKSAGTQGSIESSLAGMPKSVRDAVRGRIVRINSNGEVQVYIRVTELSDATRAELRSSGAIIELADQRQRLVQARVPIARLETLAGLPFVQLVRLPNYAFHQTGSVDTEGDAILLADQVRAQLGVTGKGVKVGVSSDGLKGVFASGCTSCQGAAGGPISTGDLPGSTGARNASGVLTSSSGGIIGQSFQSNGDLEGLPSGACAFPGAGAEGTAILEIVHDLALDAQLYFANAGTDLEFSHAVNYLASNADVVVDDVGFFGLPYDGSSAVSANTATALNSSTNPIRGYFTAAGNYSKDHYLGGYVDSGVDGASVVGAAGHLHLFQAATGTTDVLGLGPQSYDPIELPAGGEAVIILTWNDTFGASANNYDLYLVQPSTSTVVAKSTNVQTGSQDPVEVIVYTNDTGAQDTFHIIIQNAANNAATRTLNFYVLEPECAASGPLSLAPTHEKHNYNTPGSSVPAESDAGGSPVSVTSVGAICSASGAAAQLLPSSCSDTTHSSVEFFSSNGPTMDGRLKPDVSGIDGVSTTAAGNFENPFFGTSAAAPHAAGVAALLLQSAPCLASGAQGAIGNATARATLRNLILNNAVALGSPSPNDVFGYGRIDALAAARKTVPQPNGVTSQVVSGNLANGASLSLAGLGFADPDQCPLTFSWTGACGAGSGSTITCPFGASSVNLVASNNGVTMTQAVPVSIKVTNFGVGVSPATASVAAGQSASFTVSVTPQGGAFSSAVTLACSNLPQLSSCSFSQSSVTPGANPATSTLTLSTMGASASPVDPSSPMRPFGPLTRWPGREIWLFWALAITIAGVCALARQRRSRGPAVPALGLLAVLALAAVLVSCGGGSSSTTTANPGTPAGTYSITITGTAGSLVQSTTASVTVH